MPDTLACLAPFSKLLHWRRSFRQCRVVFATSLILPCLALPCLVYSSLLQEPTDPSATKAKYITLTQLEHHLPFTHRHQSRRYTFTTHHTYTLSILPCLTSGISTATRARHITSHCIVSHHITAHHSTSSSYTQPPAAHHAAALHILSCEPSRFPPFPLGSPELSIMGKSPSGLFCLYLHRRSPCLVPPLPPDGLSRHARASSFLLYRFCSCTSFGSAFTLLAIVGAVAITSIPRSTVTSGVTLVALPPIPLPS
ncbi:uncharacterized protein LY79DRAFT_314581 [Colletotrichum navitas]|uniref:Uncharacterized protein n=1 Tax=Colletotrichum navitas TaxID=681940 RepID=A0AAD8V202_9PEZI|nr:uncharacterized protein LY79DRAFT_314581 [Colletotrichum navitas]KAK1580267.1 hypothetical protein LY79DRAFT_314581 [Colletotrichum navitas]